MTVVAASLPPMTAVRTIPTALVRDLLAVTLVTSPARPSARERLDAALGVETASHLRSALTARR